MGRKVSHFSLLLPEYLELMHKIFSRIKSLTVDIYICISALTSMYLTSEISNTAVEETLGTEKRNLFIHLLYWHSNNISIGQWTNLIFYNISNLCD